MEDSIETGFISKLYKVVGILLVSRDWTCKLKLLDSVGRVSGLECREWKIQFKSKWERPRVIQALYLQFREFNLSNAESDGA